MFGEDVKKNFRSSLSWIKIDFYQSSMFVVIGRTSIMPLRSNISNGDVRVSPTIWAITFGIYVDMMTP